MRTLEMDAAELRELLATKAILEARENSIKIRWVYGIP